MNTISSTIKKIAVVVLFMIYNFSLMSQVNTYHPFPLTEGSWEVDSSNMNTNVLSNDMSSKIYTVIGDTTIGVYTYKNVFSQHSIGHHPTCPIGNGPCRWVYGAFTFAFAYRNDIPHKKVFIYTKIAGQYKDTLWYDFNLKIGDTLKQSYSFDSARHEPLQYQPIIVESIDSVLICGEYNKVFHLPCRGETLTEGIGFSGNFIYRNPWDICFFENPTVYDTYFSCNSVSVNEQPESLINQMEIFPNPVVNNLHIKFTNQTNIFIPEYSIIDCLGRVINSGTLNDNQIIDVYKLESGFYILRLYDNKGNLFQSKFFKQ